jgi:hypothetical protein
MRRAFFLLWLVGLASGCQGHFSGGVFSKDGLRYRVGEPGEPWRRVSFADNDLAWVSPQGHLLAVNATCTEHEDPPLDVLTNHLLIGFTEREVKERQVIQLDGREALRSRVHAKLDGVPTSLLLVVAKKNGCVHDFSYISPLDHEGQYEASFDKLVSQFAQERSP